MQRHDKRYLKQYRYVQLRYEDNLSQVYMQKSEQPTCIPSRLGYHSRVANKFFQATSISARVQQTKLCPKNFQVG